MVMCYIEKLRRENISTNIERVLEQIEFCSCASGGNAEIMIYNIRLALWEIFTNFVCHGSEMSCRDIHIRIDESDSEIFLQVTSIGNEFEWEGYQDIECPKVSEVRGRGLFLLQQICQHFSYEQNGQVANLIFKK